MLEPGKRIRFNAGDRPLYGLRWARQDSADLIGHGRQRPLLRVIRPPGRELRLELAPARFNSQP